MRAFFVLLWSLVLLGQAQARTVAGVEFPERIEVAGQELVLNGAGVREKFFFDIYAAGLYLPARSREARHILEQRARPWRLVMHFLYKKVDRAKMAGGWEEGFRANLDEAELARLRARLDHFESLFPDMHRGEKVVLDYQPGAGVRVEISGRPAGVIRGGDFARALLAVWLGDEPVTGALKRALLGEE